MSDTKKKKSAPTATDAAAPAALGEARYLTSEALGRLVEGLAAAGTPAVAPAWAGDAGRAAGGSGDAPETEYRVVTGAAELALGERLPRLSLKQFFLPPTEVLFSYKRNGADIVLTPLRLRTTRSCSARGRATSPPCRSSTRS